MRQAWRVLGTMRCSKNSELAPITQGRVRFILAGKVTRTKKNNKKFTAESLCSKFSSLTEIQGSVCGLEVGTKLIYISKF